MAENLALVQKIYFLVNDDGVWCHTKTDPTPIANSTLKFPICNEKPITWIINYEIPVNCPENFIRCSAYIPNIEIYDVRKEKLVDVESWDEFSFFLCTNEDNSKFFLMLICEDEDVKDITDTVFTKTEKELEFKTRGRIFSLTLKVRLKSNGILYCRHY
jgi:hypothetical protein